MKPIANGTWLLAACLLATGCEDPSKSASPEQEPPATADATAAGETKPAADKRDPAQQAAIEAIDKQAFPLTKDNHDRGALCKNARTLAEAASECKPCLEAYVKLLEGEADQRIVDCSGESLGKVKDGAQLCTALIDAWERNSQSNSQAIAGLSAQGDGCKDRFDRLLEVAEKKFQAYENAYGDLGPANLIYLQRLLDHMSAEQKKRLAEAARALEKLAAEKKDRQGKVSEATVKAARELADAASS